jgi:hypothetical protein
VYALQQRLQVVDVERLGQDRDAHVLRSFQFTRVARHQGNGLPRLSAPDFFRDVDAIVHARHLDVL